MNIFEIYLKKIKIIINDLYDKDLLKIPDKLSSITVDTTPANFKSDISTNVAMVLSKPNKKTPIEIGEIIKKKILEDDDVADVEIVKPGGTGKPILPISDKFAPLPPNKFLGFFILFVSFDLKFKTSLFIICF